MLFRCGFIVTAILVNFCYSLKWNQCGGQNVFRLKNLDIQPMPMNLPGKIKLDLQATSLKQLNGSDVSITIRKSTFLGHFKVPCIFQVGSCTYHDSCTLLKRMKDENWGGMMADIITQVDSYFSMYNIDLTCPVSKQSLTISSMNVSLPHVPSYLSFLASGSYKVHVNMVDRHTKEQTFCLDLEFSIA
ncbi:ganglioside GM2 activator [Octopus bimaculoides]|uniref:MD-2-related lipid-recognition domain-containing protein n=1 Tax=Octopus bimaculoides TaxID=37653 RepID=A0A0L8FMY9_OCTBM|nr:ganglioside GM2 activator [Octopus bimaculoides]|eukprot:XP_014788449.1 PREDICTED: ganglioside GM2 activator-like [Octopus bimaculoides]